jgi:hypothetical protein
MVLGAIASYHEDLTVWRDRVAELGGGKGEMLVAAVCGLHVLVFGLIEILVAVDGAVGTQM